MQIKWSNIIAFALALIAVVIVLSAPRQIAAFLSTMVAIGPSYSTEDKTLGFIALGLVCVTLVAVVKILTQGKDR